MYRQDVRSSYSYTAIAALPGPLEAYTAPIDFLARLTVLFLKEGQGNLLQGMGGERREVGNGMTLSQHRKSAEICSAEMGED